MSSTTSLADRLNMSSKKGFAEPQQPAQYRDDPQYAETSSMASAVLLDDVDIFPPDEELPSYEDTTKLIPGLPTPADVGPSRASPVNNTGLPENYSAYFEYVTLESQPRHIANAFLLGPLQFHLSPPMIST